MRIAIVNDGQMATEVLRRSIISVPEYEVAWTATNGAVAVALCARDRPDLVLMDLVMPIMDGVEATRQIMRVSPCPILIVTGTIQSHSSRIFDALAAGALDVTRTPANLADGVTALLEKIRGVLRLTDGAPSTPDSGSGNKRTPKRNGLPLVVIGASAGGPAALRDVLRALPLSVGAAIVIVQHIDAQFAQGLAEWLSEHCPIAVRVAQEGVRPEAGVGLLAETEDHLALAADGTLTYTPLPRALCYRPSVDVFMETAARHWRGGVIGVLLTGIGRDGVNGLRAIQRAGGVTIAQDESTSIVYGMPKAAADAGVADSVLPLEAIGPKIGAILADGMTQFR